MTTLRLRNSINLPSARRLFLLAGLLAGMLAIMGTSPASAADLVAIDVFPNNPVVQLGFAVQFTAVGTFSDGSTQDLTATATWSSSANSVATISNAGGSRGLATGVSPGSTQISAQLGSVLGSTTLTVEVFSASTSISGNFNNFTIAGGNYLWFTSVLKANGLGSTAVTITFTNQTITIPGVGSVPVPDGTVRFDPAVNFATTTFGPGGVSTTTVPSNPTLKGNTFFSGLNFLVPANLPGSIRPVTWSGTISVDTPGVSVNWQWAAANYPTFSADPILLGVKPVDDKVQNPYLNADHAGTPENFKQFVVGGGTGGGGSNFTGGLSATASVSQHH